MRAPRPAQTVPISPSHSHAAGNGHHEVQYRPAYPVTGPGLQLARCPSGQSSEEFSSFLRRPMANESCWRAASLADGAVAASFQDHSQCQRVALCLSIMHHPSSNLKSQSSRSCSCKESSRRRAERMREALTQAWSQIMAAWQHGSVRSTHLRLKLMGVLF